MDLLMQFAIGLLSLIITLVANTAAHLLPRQTSMALQATAPAQTAPASRIEYGSLESAALGKQLKYAVQLPPSYDADKKRHYPVLYFLHGMNGNEGEFEHRGIAAAVDKLRAEGKIGEFIIVAPAGENSFYINSKNGVRYEDAIIADLIPHIEKTYRAMATRDGRAIQGLSMGGWGALMLAFKHPEMFSSVTAHSAALYDQLPKPSGTDRYSQYMDRTIKRIFGDPPDEEFFQSNNPLHLAETNAGAIKKSGLKIYFDVGEQDRYGYAPSNKLLDERLTKAGIAHEFHVFPGNHGWEYMISVADHSYDFLWKNFKVNGKSASARTR
ncbi:MAG TPA: alpha/beta hydrolase family protein [Blastocatellia bacterium]|nr:alpha/beta hydrolase family protein [Blastocatellia bacterium]